MIRLVPRFLQRLRRHKGGWVLLFAALMIKIAASTVCVLDGPPLASGTPASGQAQALVTMQADTVTAGDGDVCLLGEGSGCHCACAHGAALPMTAVALTSVVALPQVVTHLPSAPPALIARSPLRPPIA